MDCKARKNAARCNCTYSPCERRGVCCECLRFHLERRELPACCFPRHAERTFDRSFEHFAQIVAELRV